MTTGLLIACVLMIVGPVTVGSVPLLLRLSSGWVNLMEIIGAGFMIGSAISVVLPEGYEALLDNCPKLQHGASDDVESATPLLSAELHRSRHLASSEHEHDHEHGSGAPLRAPGLAVLLGVLMMMVFEWSHHRFNKLHHGKEKVDEECGHRCSSVAEHAHSAPSVLTALLIHAAADGLAVGIANVSPSVRLAVSVGAAMVLHKGPVAFGLVSYLMSQGHSTASIFRDLTVFAMSSPIVAVATYALLWRFTQDAGAHNTVAHCVLFSAGTFIYAACVHMMPQLSGSKSIGPRDMVVLIVGALLPAVAATLGGHHHHQFMGSSKEGQERNAGTDRVSRGEAGRSCTSPLYTASAENLVGVRSLPQRRPGGDCSRSPHLSP
eukprot:TRINITY_DN16955_c0_g1_i1.p1 TRINITY_DN16955_c0_g1~~TRINITY_DN16955_c0_g1_i1.p1  ORF type:complete len:378 (-),score=29.72 TRINITY_DN16955_c0_g1_i1:193-1326(-)